MQQNSGGVRFSVCVCVFAPLFIWLICCVEAVWLWRREEEAPFCTVHHQKPAAVCHRRGLKPPSVYLHTDTHIHLLLYTCTHTARDHTCAHTHTHTRAHTIASRETEWETEIKRMEQSFSPHLHDRVIFTSHLMERETKGFIVIRGSERMKEATWREINQCITEGWERREEPYRDRWSSSRSFCSSVVYGSAEQVKWCALSLNNLGCHWQYAARCIRENPRGHKSLSILFFSSLSPSHTLTHANILHQKKGCCEVWKHTQVTLLHNQRSNMLFDGDNAEYLLLWNVSREIYMGYLLRYLLCSPAHLRCCSIVRVYKAHLKGL